MIRLIYKSLLDLLYLKGLGGLFLAREEMKPNRAHWTHQARWKASEERTNLISYICYPCGWGDSKVTRTTAAGGGWREFEEEPKQGVRGSTFRCDAERPCFNRFAAGSPAGESRERRWNPSDRTEPIRRDGRRRKSERTSLAPSKNRMGKPFLSNSMRFLVFVRFTFLHVLTMVFSKMLVKH